MYSIQRNIEHDTICLYLIVIGIIPSTNIPDIISFPIDLIICYYLLPNKDYPYFWNEHHVCPVPIQFLNIADKLPEVISLLCVKAFSYLLLYTTAVVMFILSIQTFLPVLCLMKNSLSSIETLRVLLPIVALHSIASGLL